ncbi:alpha-tocopherol transfer protein-like [Aphomia sociella]
MSVEVSSYFEILPEQREAGRKLFDLDKPERLEEAINILEDWIKKQDHFIIKDFDKDYLERLIITNKGLLERVKRVLDKSCTLRTFNPEFFGPFKLTDFKDIDPIIDVTLPKLLPDNYRIQMIRVENVEFPSSAVMNSYRRAVIMWESLLRFDVCIGVIFIMDLRAKHCFSVLSKFTLFEKRTFLMSLQGAYGIRVKEIHVLTQTSMFDTFLTISKLLLSTKLLERIHFHQNLDTLHAKLPKDLLPVDYGGKELPLSELQEKWNIELSSQKYVDHFKFLSEAKTNESLRTAGQFNEEHLGIPGSFRGMVVD